MSLTQSHRLQLHDIMKDKIGATGADLLLEALPVDATQLATKTDVDNVRIELRGEMSELRGEFAELRGEMVGEFAAVRGEMAAEFAEMRGEMATEFADVRGEISELRTELLVAVAGLSADLKMSMRNTIITIVAAALTIWLTFYVPEVMG